MFYQCVIKIQKILLSLPGVWNYFAVDPIHVGKFLNKNDVTKTFSPKMAFDHEIIFGFIVTFYVLFFFFVLGFVACKLGNNKYESEIVLDIDEYPETVNILKGIEKLRKKDIPDSVIAEKKQSTAKVNSLIYEINEVFFREQRQNPRWEISGLFWNDGKKAIKINTFGDILDRPHNSIVAVQLKDYAKSRVIGKNIDIIDKMEHIIHIKEQK